MFDRWVVEIKQKCDPQSLGMILVHNGVVRGTSKDGKQVKKMQLSFDQDKLDYYLKAFKDREGIAEIKVWINHGLLRVGDDIMRVLVAGRFRTDVMPVFQEFLSVIKNDIVSEVEVSS